jgi:hypothetical protein
LLLRLAAVLRVDTVLGCPTFPAVDWPLIVA